MSLMKLFGRVAAAVVLQAVSAAAAVLAEKVVKGKAAPVAASDPAPVPAFDRASLPERTRVAIFGPDVLTQGKEKGA